MDAHNMGQPVEAERNDAHVQPNQDNQVPGPAPAAAEPIINYGDYDFDDDDEVDPEVDHEANRDVIQEAIREANPVAIAEDAQADVDERGDADNDDEDDDEDDDDRPRYPEEEAEFARQRDEVLIRELGPYRHEVIQQITERAQNNRRQVDVILDIFLQKLLRRDGIEIPREELSEGFEAYFQSLRVGSTPQEAFLGVGTPQPRPKNSEE